MRKEFFGEASAIFNLLVAIGYLFDDRPDYAICYLFLGFLCKWVLVVDK